MGKHCVVRPSCCPLTHLTTVFDSRARATTLVEGVAGVVGKKACTMLDSNKLITTMKAPRLECKKAILLACSYCVLVVMVFSPGWE